MKKITFIIFFLLLLGCSSVPVKDHPDPGDIVANFPIMEIGDSWRTLDFSEKAGSDEYMYTVTRVDKNKSFDLHILGRKSGLDIYKYYDMNKDSIHGILSNDVDNHLLNFPLFIGKSWKSKQRAKALQGGFNDFRSKYLIEKYEAVITTAGTFNAFKIMRKSTNMKTGWMGTDYFWYSPGIKGIIKSDHEYKRGTELLEFNIKEKSSIYLKN